MTFRGSIKNGVVVFDGEVPLPEGTVVEIQPVEKSEKFDDPISHLGDLAVPTGIPDLAKNIDHYLYGHIKFSNKINKRGGCNDSCFQTARKNLFAQ
jgi:hypothetical protein